MTVAFFYVSPQGIQRYFHTKMIELLSFLGTKMAAPSLVKTSNKNVEVVVFLHDFPLWLPEDAKIDNQHVLQKIFA